MRGEKQSGCGVEELGRGGILGGTEGKEGDEDREGRGHTSTSTSGSMAMEVICFTVSGGE